MFISTKRTIALVCVVFAIALVMGYQSLKQSYLPNPIQNIFINGTFEPLSALKPFWTTEQEEPRFAYVQYATDMNYLCSAVR